MKCSDCGSENKPGKKFCAACGIRLAPECPQCGGEVGEAERFCGECGHRLTDPGEPPPVDYTALHAYTPKHLTQKILTARSALAGERKVVTVLFADVANFTALSEKLDPEDVHRILDGCFRILMDQIHRYEGTINQLTGDGVMALFGAPVAHEDHARRACHAALGIQRAMARFGGWLRAERGQETKAFRKLEAAEAAQELGLALERAEALGFPTLLSQTHRSLGDLHLGQGKSTDARAHYGKAGEIVQGIADGLTDEELRRGFLASATIRELFRRAEP